MRQTVRCAVERREDGSTLEWRGRDTVVRQTSPNDAISFCERPIEVPARSVKSERNVAGNRVVQTRSELVHRSLLLGYRRELLVVDDYRGQCIVRGLRRLCRDRCDRFSGIPHAISSQYRMLRHDDHAWSDPIAG